jgi:hypothetical protein
VDPGVRSQPACHGWQRAGGRAGASCRLVVGGSMTRAGQKAQCLGRVRAMPRKTVGWAGGICFAGQGVSSVSGAGSAYLEFSLAACVLQAPVCKVMGTRQWMRRRDWIVGCLQVQGCCLGLGQAKADRVLQRR